MGKIHLDEISQKNRQTVKDFLKWAKAEGLEKGTRQMYYYSLKKLDEMDEPLEDITKDQMQDKVIEIKESDLAEGTVKSVLARIKRFYKWLLADPNGDDYPEVVDWITVPRPNGNTLPDDILTKDEIRDMIEVCDHPQDRAIISTLYESGLRASEFVGLNKGSVEFDKRMGRIILPRNGEGQKTGQRRVPLINSIPHLQDWLNEHPLEGREEPLWISLSPSCYHDRLGYSGLRKKLLKIGREAGVDKNTRPHIFRHSRATEIAGKGIYSEAEMRIMFGWAKASNQPSRYIHLAGADVDDKFKKDHGIVEEEEEKEKGPLEPVECPRCDHRNPPGAKFCSKCGLGLELEAVKELEAKEERTGPVMAELGISEDEAEKVIKAAEKILETRSEKG